MGGSRANVGRTQSGSMSSDVSKATDKVKNQRMGSRKSDSDQQIKAKIKRTKRQLSAEQSARRKSSKTNSGARTKAQIKKDMAARERLGRK
jgi:hypothetical protein